MLSSTNRTFSGVWRKMHSSSGISECSHPHTGISEGSGEKCTHPQEFQRGMERYALIHRNFRGVWRKMLSSTYRNFSGVWRKMHSSTGISECSRPHTGVSEGSGEKCTHPQEFQRGLKKIHLRRASIQITSYTGGGVHIKWMAQKQSVLKNITEYPSVWNFCSMD